MRLLFLLLALLNAASGLAEDPKPRKHEPRVVDQWYLAVHTIADANSLRTSVQAYAIDNNHYPLVTNIEELRPLLEPIYIRTMPTKDAWGTPFVYRSVDDGKSFVIASAGSDRKFDESTWGAGYTMLSKDDLVYQGDSEREWVIQTRCK